MFSVAIIWGFLLLSARAAPTDSKEDLQHVILNYDTGNHQHVQTGQPGKAVHGIYSYEDADGKMRTTSYAADDKGFRVSQAGKEEEKPIAPVQQQDEKKQQDDSELLRSLLSYYLHQQPYQHPVAPFGYYHQPQSYNQLPYFKNSNNAADESSEYPPGLYPIEVTVYDDLSGVDDEKKSSLIDAKSDLDLESILAGLQEVPSEDRKLKTKFKILAAWKSIATINLLKLILSFGLIG